MSATRVRAVPCFYKEGRLTDEMLARVFLFVCFLGGCGVIVRTTPLDVATKPRRPRPASEVEVYAAGRPTYPFVDFALMEGWLNDYRASERVLAQLREEAGKLGCDALVVLEGLTRPPYFQVQGYRAACIVRTDVQAVAARPTEAGAPGGSAVAAPPATEADRQFPATLVVAASVAVVRVAPANIAPEVARLPAGSALAAAGPAERGWYRVRLSDGRLGYAAEGELRPAP